VAVVGRLVQKLVRDSTTVHKYKYKNNTKTQNTQNRKQKYKNRNKYKKNIIKRESCNFDKGGFQG
jgi:hypothetical protein